MGCSLWGREESDTTERVNFHFSLSCIGERNGNPLQCSCLENPGTGEPGWLQSMGSLELDMTSLSLSLFTFMYWRRKWQPTPVFLPGESRDGGAWWPAVWGGCTESDMTEATLQQQWQQHKHNY